MLEKSNRTGPLTEQNPANWLTARLRVSTTRKIFKTLLRKFFELDYFDVFSDFQISFLAFCYVVLTNLARVFPFFRQIEKKF